MATARKALVNLVLRDITGKSFGRALKIDAAGAVMQDTNPHSPVGGDKTAFVYTVPAPLCHAVPCAQDPQVPVPTPPTLSQREAEAGVGVDGQQAQQGGTAGAATATATAGGGGVVMGVGAVMAVFDELSTYAFMMKDTHARPGVSVFLSAGMTQALLL